MTDKELAEIMVKICDVPAQFNSPRPNWLAADPYTHIPHGWEDRGDGTYWKNPLK